MEFLEAQDVFAQLSRTHGSEGVRSVIENHDAWTNAESIEKALNAALRARLEHASDALQAARVARQRHALAPLVTRLPARQATAC
jgi:hypothetical protein